jgi:hypothetical protein
MDYVARLKQDAVTARHLAVLFGVKVVRGMPLDAASMYAAIEKAGFGKSDRMSLADASGLVTDDFVAFVTPSETVIAKIEELKTKLAESVFLVNQLSSCLQVANNGFQEARNGNECVTLKKQILEKARA